MCVVILICREFNVSSSGSATNLTLLNRLRFILHKLPAIKCASQALCVTNCMVIIMLEEDTGEENSAILYLHIVHGMGNIEGSQGVNITFL